MKIILMRLRITIAMLEIRNRETLQSKVNICKSDVKIGDYADSLSVGKVWSTILRKNDAIGQIAKDQSVVICIVTIGKMLP